MDAEPFAGAASVDRGGERSGAAPVDVLPVLGPVKDRLGAGIAGDHPRMIVIGVMGQCLDRDEIAGFDRDDRRQ
jgi:hypothetical protein